MAEPVNSQVGAQFRRDIVPRFDGYRVQGGTWKPTDLLKDEDIEDENEEIMHTSFWGPGTRVECMMVAEAGSAPLTKSMVIDEVATADNPAPVSWLVKKADPTTFGRRAQRYSVTLQRTDAQDLTEVS